MSAIDAAIVKYSSVIPPDRVQQVRADAMRLLLDVATGACDESAGWFGQLGDCKRKRLGKELRRQGEHLAENVASWKVGKVVGGAIAAYAASKGYDSHAVKLLSETAVQATTATLLSMRDKKNRSPEKVATKLIAESAAALMGKLAHGGFEDAAESISPDRVNEIGRKIAQAFKDKGINPDEATVKRAIDNHPKLKDLPDESKAALAKAAIGKPEAKPAKPKRESSKDVIARGDALMPDELKGAIEKARPILDRQEKLKGMLDKAQRAMKQGKKPTEQQRANMDKALDEYRKLKGSKELKALENEMKVFRERLIDDSPASDKDASAFAKGLKFDSNISAADQNAVRETAREYYKLMGGAGTGTIKEFKRTDDRASARPWENSVNVGAKSQDKAVMMHEMAHHFEYADKAIGAASLDFIQSRATTKEPKKLSEITGNLRYRDNEIAYEDAWVSPYIGKVYRNGDKIVPATEVVSVGVEHFADPKAMMKLATKDPEHFKLVLGMMRK